MTKFPARFKHGDLVNVNFQDAGFLEGGVITKVSFTDSEVLYDVELTVETEIDENTTTFYKFVLNAIPSYYVSLAEVLNEEEL